MLIPPPSTLSFICLIELMRLSANSAKVSIERYPGKLRYIWVSIPQLAIQRYQTDFLYVEGVSHLQRKTSYQRAATSDRVIGSQGQDGCIGLSWIEFMY